MIDLCYDRFPETWRYFFPQSKATDKFLTQWIIFCHVEIDQELINRSNKGAQL